MIKYTIKDVSILIGWLFAIHGRAVLENKEREQKITAQLIIDVTHRWAQRYKI